MKKNNKSTHLNSGNMSEAIENIRRMFVDETQIKRIVIQDQTPAKRAAFAKTHGIVNGVLQINDNINAEYQVGIFQPGKNYTVWVRYSSDTEQTAPDFETTVGMGIKVFNVSGKKVLDEEPDGTTVDLILQNTAVFFAADAIEMSDFKAAAMSGNLEEFRKTHPESADILDSMEKEVPSLLTEKYWSCIPYKFGVEYCKYIIEYQTASDPSSSINVKDNNYLAQDLSERLMNGNAILNFYIQKRNNPEKQSIISARSLWDEKEAKPVKVATLTLYQQNIQTRKQFSYGESLAYNIFRTLPEMEPVGSIAEARKVVYQSSAMVRRNVNGESIGEPVQPRSTRFLHYNLSNNGNTGGDTGEGTGGNTGGGTGGNTGGGTGGDTGGGTGGNTGGGTGGDTGGGTGGNTGGDTGGDTGGNTGGNTGGGTGGGTGGNTGGDTGGDTGGGTGGNTGGGTGGNTGGDTGGGTGGGTGGDTGGGTGGNTGGGTGGDTGGGTGGNTGGGTGGNTGGDTGGGTGGNTGGGTGGNTGGGTGGDTGGGTGGDTGGNNGGGTGGDTGGGTGGDTGGNTGGNTGGGTGGDTGGGTGGDTGGGTGGDTGGGTGGDTGGGTGGNTGGNTGGGTGGNTGGNIENYFISPNGFPDYYTIKDRRTYFWSQYQYLPFYINKNDIFTVFVDGETEDNLFASIGLPSSNIDIYPLSTGSNSFTIESSGLLSFINNNEEGEIYIKINSQHQRIPYFKLHENTNSEFKTEMLIYNSAPYVILSNSLSDIIITYSSANLYIDDAEELMEDYELFIEIENNISGLVENGKADYKLDNNRNLHIEVDFYYIHANNDYTGYNIGAIPQLLGRSNNRFDVWYINGAQRQQEPWQWSSGTEIIEAAANIYSLSVQEALTGRASRIDEYRENIENFIADTSLSKSFDIQDAFVKSGLFWQLYLTFGEHFYPQLNQKYRLMDDTLLTEDDDSKKQIFILTVSQLVNTNLLPFFLRWGLELDLNTIFELSLLPGLEEPIWENNNDNYHQLDMPEHQYIPELIHLKNAISDVVIEKKLIKFTIDKEWYSPYRYVFFINDYYIGEISEGDFYYCNIESADEEFYVFISPDDIDEILDDDVFEIIIDFQGEHISYYSTIKINNLQEDIESIFTDNDANILEDEITHSTLDNLWDRYNECKNEHTIHLKNRLRRAEYILLSNTIIESYIQNDDIIILFSEDDAFLNYQYMLHSNEGYLSEITYGKNHYAALNDRVWTTDSKINSTTAEIFYIKAFSRDEEYILSIISFE